MVFPNFSLLSALKLICLKLAHNISQRLQRLEMKTQSYRLTNESSTCKITAIYQPQPILNQLLPNVSTDKVYHAHNAYKLKNTPVVTVLYPRLIMS